MARLTAMPPTMTENPLPPPTLQELLATYTIAIGLRKAEMRRAVQEEDYDRACFAVREINTINARIKMLREKMVAETGPEQTVAQQQDAPADCERSASGEAPEADVQGDFGSGHGAFTRPVGRCRPA